MQSARRGQKDCDVSASNLLPTQSIFFFANNPYIDIDSFCWGEQLYCIISVAKELNKHIFMTSSENERLAILPAGARVAYNGLDTEASR